MISTAPSSPAASRADKAWRVLLAAVLGMLLCAAVQAKQGDRSQPINVDANHSDTVYKANGVIHLEGNVVITQGTLKVTSDKATAYLDGQSQVKHVVLTGHAHIQQEDDQGKLMTGDAQTIDYDMASGIAVLTGNAEIHKAGTGSISGEKVVYNTNSGQMSAQGTGDKRVHMVFKPRQQPAAASSARKAPGKGN